MKYELKVELMLNLIEDVYSNDLKDLVISKVNKGELNKLQGLRLFLKIERFSGSNVPLNEVKRDYEMRLCNDDIVDSVSSKW